MTSTRRHAGWYNLEESSDDIYKKSKLRQFLRCLNLMMEVRDSASSVTLNLTSRDGVRATQVSVLREEVRAALQRSVEPLRQYLATYEIYLDFLRLDVDAYVAQAVDDFGGPPPGTISAF